MKQIKQIKRKIKDSDYFNCDRVKKRKQTKESKYFCQATFCGEKVSY